MKVLLIAHRDHANVGYELSQCLKSVGIDALCITRNPHPFYSMSAKLCTNQSEIDKLSEESDIIIFMHSKYSATGVEVEYNKTKGVLVYHGGSDYRIYPGKVNKLFREKGITLSLIQTLDLWHLDGFNNDIWFLPPVNSDKLKPNYKKQVTGKRIISHFPSTTRKGTKVIDTVIRGLLKDSNLSDKFIYSGGFQQKPYEDHLNRLSLCDIYVESFHPVDDYTDSKSGTRPCGEWGISALEAASMGKVVVTNFFSHERYEKEYGSHKIQISNSVNDLEKNLRRLILMPDDDFLRLQQDTRQWVEEFHSYKSVGNRLLDIFYKYLTWKNK